MYLCTEQMRCLLHGHDRQGLWSLTPAPEPKGTSVELGAAPVEPGAAFLVRLRSVMLRKSGNLTTAQPVGPQRRKDVTMTRRCAQLNFLLLANSTMSFHGILQFEIFSKTSRFAKYVSCPHRVAQKISQRTGLWQNTSIKNQQVGIGCWCHCPPPQNTI